MRRSLNLSLLYYIAFNISIRRIANIAFNRLCIVYIAFNRQMKYNMGYKRFRHFGKDKVLMDFAFFAIAFNIKKMAAKLSKQGFCGQNNLCVAQSNTWRIPLAQTTLFRKRCHYRRSA